MSTALALAAGIGACSSAVTPVAAPAPPGSRMPPSGAPGSGTSSATPAPVVSATVRADSADSVDLSADTTATRQAAISIADSVLSNDDMPVTLAALIEEIRRGPRSAARWHRLGTALWAIVADSSQPGKLSTMHNVRRQMLADSALKMAVTLAPDSGVYWFDFARYRLLSGVAATRLGSRRFFKRAYEAATKSRDSVVAALAADEVGMSYWRDYQDMESRYSQVADLDEEYLQTVVRDPKSLTEYISVLTRGPIPNMGDQGFREATDWFARGASADPTAPTVARHAFMALAAMKRWEELRVAATSRALAAPDDPFGWLVLGLACHRGNDVACADSAFDRGLRSLTPEDSQRVTRISRLLRNTDSVRLAALTTADRTQLERAFWALSDPMWLTKGNEHWLEFLSRVIYADLQWTSDEFKLNGSDTDRGEIFIRFGPPVTIIGLRGPIYIYSIWRYEDGVSFIFQGQPGFGTRQFAFEDRDRAQRIVREAAPRWSNLEVDRHVDTIPVRVANFRAAGDSTDVFVVADVPAGRLLKGVDIRNPGVVTDFQIVGGGVRRLTRDSSLRTIQTEMTTDTTLTWRRSWQVRLRNRGALYRVEAFQPDVQHGARAMGVLRDLAANGFGISDAILGERVLPREGRPAERWQDFVIAPLVGSVARGRSISLLWETYDLAASDTGSRYRVSLSMRRTDRGKTARVAGEIVGRIPGLGNLRSRERDGATSLSFNRSVASRPVVVDYLTLELGRAEAGEYEIVLDVEDLIAHRHDTRRIPLTITP